MKGVQAHGQVEEVDLDDAVRIFFHLFVSAPNSPQVQKARKQHDEEYAKEQKGRPAQNKVGELIFIPLFYSKKRIRYSGKTQWRYFRCGVGRLHGDGRKPR